MIEIVLKFFISLDTQTIGITPQGHHCQVPAYLSPSLSPVLNLLTLLRSMIIKAKEFTMSHLDRFKKINVLSVKC